MKGRNGFSCIGAPHRERGTSSYPPPVSPGICRQEGQSKAEELSKKTLRAELEERERKYFVKSKGHSFEGIGWGNECLLLGWDGRQGELYCRHGPSRSLTAEREEDLRLLESSSHSQTAQAPRLIPRAADADDADDDDSASESEDDDVSEGWTAGLLQSYYWSVLMVPRVCFCPNRRMRRRSFWLNWEESRQNEQRKPREKPQKRLQNPQLRNKLCYLRAIHS